MQFLPLLLALATSAVAVNLESSVLRSELYEDNLFARSEVLQACAETSTGSKITRAFGSVGHECTLDYIRDTLEATEYYNLNTQTFDYLYSEGEATFSAEGVEYASGWFTYGPAGDVTAELVPVDNVGCTLEDFPDEVEGQIALIQRGTCEFGLKVAYAGAAGAAGVIIYNNIEGSLSGTLSQVSRPEGPYVPAASITLANGTYLLEQIEAGPVEATLFVDAITENRTTSNVIAISKGGDQNNIVFSGAHTDSVPEGPGINDDGSGTVGLLELATLIANYTTNNAVGFGFWTAEEFGLVGSEHYVASLSANESAKYAVYLNFDMIASPNYAFLLYDGDGSAFNVSGPAGSDHIEHLFEDYFAEQGIITAPTAFDGRSDYGPFLEIGVASGGVFTGAEEIKTEEEVEWWGGVAGESYDQCYHQACDNITNLDLGAFLDSTKAAAHAIATYADSLEGIPRNVSSIEKRKLDRRFSKRSPLLNTHKHGHAIIA